MFIIDLLIRPYNILRINNDMDYVIFNGLSELKSTDLKVTI
ncbi:hypothetical protein SAMN05421749_10226 [Acinetobacter marinus]|uniref:Uncharacterized protein n=1 Tax=Acinetobacter marinus TaxID=281375 RepID=A0A1G6HAT6_9GAMM|nr:hypothetical protein SAMN05421749_10226 [Acinetobacter marinus]